MPLVENNLAIGSLSSMLTFSTSLLSKNNSAFLREAQLNTMFNTSNTGMVVSLDVGDENSIHPPRKFILGKRLAYWALNKDYGFLLIS